MMAAKYQVDRRVKLVLDTGKEKVTLENLNRLNHLLEIQFSVPFSSEPTPDVATVTIMNLSKKTRALFKKGEHGTLYAGYKGDVGVLTEGNINKIPPLLWSGVDSQFSFTFIQGADYSKKKDVSITFKKKSGAEQVIKTIAKKAGIPLKSVKLQIPKDFKKGYTADGQPLELIESIAKKCGSVLRIVRGKYCVVYDTSASDLQKIVRTRRAAVRSAHTHYTNKVRQQGTAAKYRSSTTATISKDRAQYKKNLTAAQGRLDKAKTKSGKSAAKKSVAHWQQHISEVGGLKSHKNAVASYAKRTQEVKDAKDDWENAQNLLNKAEKALRKAGGAKKNSTATKPAEFLLSNTTGLTEEPSYSEDDDGESWSFSCLLQHRITTDAVIKVKSRNLNRTMVVDNGEHAYDGSSFLTTGVLK